MFTANTISQNNTKPRFSNKKYNFKSAIIGGIGFIAAALTVAHYTIDFTTNLTSNNQIKLEQHKIFIAANNKVAPLLWKWNSIETIKDDSKIDVRTIKSEIENFIKEYPSLNTSDLSLATQLIHKWHTVKLYNVYIDILQSNSDKKNAIVYLVKATELLNIINDILDDRANILTAKDKEYIKIKELRNRVKQTQLVSMAFSKILLPDDRINNEKLHKLFNTFGGCEKANSSNIRHRDLLAAFGCNIQVQN